MGKTRIVAITTSWTAIAATVASKKITVGESVAVAGWPTVDLEIAKPTSADAAVRIPTGSQYSFLAGPGQYSHILPDEIVGYIRTASGSTSIFIDEAE